MNSIALLGTRVCRAISCLFVFQRKFCDQSFGSDTNFNSSHRFEEPLNRIWRFYDADSLSDGISNVDEHEHEHSSQGNLTGWRSFTDAARNDASRVLDILQQDGPGFDTKSALDNLNFRVSGIFVREVLLAILRSIDSYETKERCAKVGYQFFVWCGEQKYYRHTTNSYHLMMKILAECEEYKAMWRIVDEMTESGLPATARTFNILICTCGEAGLARKVVERFIKSKDFYFRPFRHSYNAILLSLVVLNRYKLIEWVYDRMLSDGYSPDVLTYNIVICAKYRLGKLEQFHNLLDEMGVDGISPDLHTYNILLHVLGKGDKPLAALNLLNHMKEVGIDPCVIHFTTLIDGLSRAGNLDACKYFFDEMVKTGLAADVVCYTVMITGYVAAKELEMAQLMFDEMKHNGLRPNVFTYNSMIHGLCMAKKFKEACLLLEEMESRGCSPNFVVYNTLVSNLRKAGKLSEAHKVIRRMVGKGRYLHLVSQVKKYKRC